MINRIIDFSATNKLVVFVLTAAAVLAGWYRREHGDNEMMRPYDAVISAAMLTISANRWVSQTREALARAAGRSLLGAGPPASHRARARLSALLLRRFVAIAGLLWILSATDGAAAATFTSQS